MCNLFDNIPLDNEEQISEERVQNIKTSVLSRIKKEENTMSKRTTIRTITIAVAAATTAALSAMIASAEQPAWTPAAAIEENEEMSEMPGEAAFKEYIEKAKAEDVGAPEKAPENVNGWTIATDEEDLICMQPADNQDVYYYYYKIPDEELREKLNNGWTLLDEDINAIHKNEVFADD